MLELPRLHLLGGEVNALVEEELAGTLEAVRGEEAPREHAVDRAVEPERVRGDEPHDLLPEGVRVPQAAHDAPRDAGAELRMVAVVRVGLGLPRSWNSAARRTGSDASASAAFCTTAKRCSSSGTGWRAVPSS